MPTAPSPAMPRPLDEVFGHIYILSMRGASERRTYVSRVLDKSLDLKESKHRGFTFFDALDGNNVSQELARRLTRKVSSTQSTEYGRRKHVRWDNLSTSEREQ
eukprot:6713567-Prymnesium_polylepis.1